MVSDRMTRLHNPLRTAALAAQALTVFAGLVLAGPAVAQDRSQPGFLDNLFSRGEPQQPRGESSVEFRRNNDGGQVAQADPGDMSVRLDRIENTLRQLTGTLEQLQFRNQQLEQQVRALQGGGAAAPPQPQYQPQPAARPSVPAAAPPAATPGRRGDVFDPAQQPNAPGAPRTLGNQASIVAPEPVDNGPPVGAPGGRDAGAPLDLSTMSGNPPIPAGTMANAVPDQTTLPPVMRQTSQQQVSAQPQQQPARSVNMPPPQAQQQLATLPPTAKPQDEYDMAYGYVLHKDYALAEQAFRDFVRKYPNDRLMPDAQYWLGETLFQRQRYRDAAESFLAVSTKYEKAGKAPDSLLRLGQSLAALNQKEAACATLAEVERKFPKASASVKRGVTAEQKKAKC
jgi:tol-pal system protein YbgF